MRVTTCQYEPMRLAIACVGTLLVPGPGPVGNFDLSAIEAPRAKELLDEIRKISAAIQHRCKESAGYSAKCQAYSSATWLPRTKAMPDTFQTTVLDLNKNLPIVGTNFYYDAADITGVRFYSLVKPQEAKDTKKITQLAAVALLVQVFENLENMRSLDVEE